MTSPQRTLTFEDIGGWDGWRFTVVVDVSGPAPVASTLTISPPDGTDLAEVAHAPLGKIVRAAAADSRPDAVASFSEVIGPPLRRPYRTGKSDPRDTRAHLEQVAAAYRLASERGLPPGTSIALFYRVGPGTVSRWLAEARGEGFLS